MEAATLILQLIFIGAALLLLHTGLIYPCIAMLVGVARKTQSAAPLPSVSVLTPAHNEASVIAAKIANFLELDYPPESIELIVADDGSSDGTADVVERHLGERMRLLRIGQRGGKANAMNELARAASHSVLIFTDANVLFRPDVVRRLTEHLDDQRVGAVTGEVRLEGSDKEFAAGEKLYYCLERKIQSAESRLGSVMGVDGAMYLVRKELYRPIPVDTILDDFLVSISVIRSGKRIIYDSRARAIETGTPTARQEFARRVRIAAGAIQLLKRGQVPRLDQPWLWFQFFSHKLLRWFAPAILAVLFVSNWLLASQGLGYRVFFGCQVAIYLAILSTYLVPTLRNNGLGSVLFYAGISQVATVVGFLKGIFNRQPPQWEKGRRIEEFLGGR